MPTEIKYRGGTAEEHTAFTGADREVTVNTTNKSLHVHDGSTANGFELARADLSNISAATFASLTAGVTMIFIRSADQPGTPDPSSTTPTGWEANADNTTGDDPLWSSFGVKEAGETDYTWQTPVRTTGEAGADGTNGVDGATGETGADGARHAEIYMYYNTPQSSAPTPPTSGEVSYNFSTSVATVTASGWSVNFNPSAISSDNTANNKYWAVRVTFQEASAGGTVYATVTSAFTWLNFDGLVTFTNLSSGTNENGVGTTFIDGGSITANSITTSSLIADFIEVGNAASDINSGVTTIDGGKITTGSITVDQLDVEEAFNVGSGGLISGTAPYPSDWTAPTSAPAALSGARFGVSDAGWTFVDTLAVYGHIYSLSATCSGSLASPLHYVKNTSSSGIGYKATVPSSSVDGLSTNGSATISGGVSPFTGMHVGCIAKNSVIEQGDIVCDSEIVHTFDFSNVFFRAVKSSSSNQAATGVMNNIRAFTDEVRDEFYQSMGDDYTTLKTTDDRIVYNAVGEGKINVCGENGDIAVGDLIVTSNTAGKGMKQADDIVRSYTVAKAREAVTFSDPSEVRQIACIYMCG